MVVLEKRLCPSAKISHTVSCNISLYRDTKEVIYRYTQNVYRCISNIRLPIATYISLPISYDFNVAKRYVVTVSCI